MLKIFYLAVLQGVAEFLPISSSGHLVIARDFLGLGEVGMGLDLVLHVGTLLSVFLFYRRTIWRIIRNFEWRYVLLLGVSGVPAVVVYLIFHDFIDGLFQNSRMVGALLMFTGAVLFGTRYLPIGKEAIGIKRALLMGLGQAMALLPGVSRSGMTLACARSGKVDPEQAAEFSFLMSAPLIIGGMVLDLAKGDSLGGFGWQELLLGGVVAAVVGYISLVVLVRTLKSRWFWLFGPYCLVAGLVTLMLTK